MKKLMTTLILAFVLLPGVAAAFAVATSGIPPEPPFNSTFSRRG